MPSSQNLSRAAVVTWIFAALLLGCQKGPVVTPPLTPTKPATTPTPVPPVPVNPPVAEVSPPVETLDEPVDSPEKLEIPKQVATPLGATFPLDLSKFVGLKAADFDKSGAYPWPGSPRGLNMFAGVPVRIDGAMMLWGKSNADRGMAYPETYEGIPIDAEVTSLYVCHAAFFEAEPESPIFHVVFHYDEETAKSESVVCGGDARDWFVSREEENFGPTGKRSRLGWAGNGRMRGRPQMTRFCVTALANPHPEKKVVSIDLVSDKSNTAGCITAITVGPNGLLETKLAESSSKNANEMARLGLANREAVPTEEPTTLPSRALPPGVIFGEYFDRVSGASARYDQRGHESTAGKGPGATRTGFFADPEGRDSLTMRSVDDDQTNGPDGKPGVLALLWEAVPPKSNYTGFVFMGWSGGPMLQLPPVSAAKSPDDLKGVHLRFKYRAANTQSPSDLGLTVGVRIEPNIPDSYGKRLEFGVITATDAWNEFTVKLSEGSNIEPFLAMIAAESPREFMLIFSQRGPITNYQPGDTLLIDDIEFAGEVGEAAP